MGNGDIFAKSPSIITSFLDGKLRMMNLSKLVNKPNSFVILAAVATQMMLVSAVSASPYLIYYYAQLKLNRSECLRTGYKALTNRHLHYPSTVIGDSKSEFAIGNDQSVVVIIDCSQASQNGRITVMASSENFKIATSYAQNILIDIGRYSGTNINL